MVAGRKERYEDLFLIFSKKVERWLVRLIAWLLITLIAMQTLLRIPEVRYFLTEVVKLEGTRVHDFATAITVWYNVVHSQALPAFLLSGAKVLSLM